MLPYSYLALLNENQTVALLTSQEQTVMRGLPLVGILAAVEYHLSYNKGDGSVRIHIYHIIVDGKAMSVSL